MRTLELKDIAAYLPYGLYYQWKNMDSMRPISMLYGEEYGTIHNVSHACKRLCDGNANIVLRPMSDLTKEITHKGEKFVPMDRIQAISRFLEFDDYGLLFMRNGCTQSKWQQVFDKLSELMFDYRGLIDAGLAVDVNTLPENPYEA